MSEIVEREYDDEQRAEWGDGPWQSEPDKVVWIDPATDLDCMIHRNWSGIWCGYVAVTKEHPWFEASYDDVDAEVNVHGGLTYANRCQGNLCHVPEDGRDGDVWWLGFDCGHMFDLNPGMNARARAADLEAEYPLFPDEVYRDIEFARAETVQLAAQIAAAR